MTVVAKDDQRYEWNDDIGNFCLEDKQNGQWVFKEPLEPLQLRAVDKADLAESLQVIHRWKTGTIDTRIGRNYEWDKQKAMDMGVW